MNAPRPDPSDRHVLLLAADLSTGGGVNKVICDLAWMFKRRLAAKVSVVSARSDRPAAYRFPNDVPLKTHPRQSLPAYFLLLLKLRWTRPDVLISSWTQDNILAALAFAFSRTKVILVEHSSWNFHGKFIQAARRITYPLASAVVVLNPTDLDHFAGYLPKVHLIPDPIASAPPPATRRDKIVLAIGHLEPLKQFDQTIRAFAKSGLEQQEWSLEIIGSGGQRQALQVLIDTLGLGRVTIHAPTDDLGSSYDRASFLMVTSRTESFSLVLAEAMSRGVVPLAYGTNGPRFILEDFPDHVIPLHDAETLASRLAYFASAGDLDSLRLALRESIERRFGEQIIAESWKDLLSRITMRETAS